MLSYTAATYHVAEFSNEENGEIGHCHALSFAVELDGLIYLLCFRNYLIYMAFSHIIVISTLFESLDVISV